MLSAVAELIDGMLREDLDAPRKQRHTSRRIWQRLRDEHHEAVSYSYVCQYAGARRAELEAEHRAAAGSVEGFVPQAKEPGAEAEVDFGPVSIVLDGEMAACHLFAYRLSYSGKAVHRVYASQAQEAFLEGHVTAFGVTGGYDVSVPHRRLVAARMVAFPAVERRCPGRRACRVCRSRRPGADAVLGDPVIDEYLEFAARPGADPTRCLPPPTTCKVFFSVVGKEPSRVSTADVFAFLSAQRAPAPRRSRCPALEDGEAGLSARDDQAPPHLRCRGCSPTWSRPRRRRITERNPVPRGLATRSPPESRDPRGVPLLRHTADAAADPRPPLMSMRSSRALRTHRDRAMVAAMLLGALRRCEVLGPAAARTCGVGEHRLFIAEGKGGHQRIVPLSAKFFTTLGRLPRARASRRPHRPRVFLVLRGPGAGQPLTAAGLDQILHRSLATAPAWLSSTCHQLRHTCLTRLREAGMALEAVQAQAGHRSIESTRSISTSPMAG